MNALSQQLQQFLSALKDPTHATNLFGSTHPGTSAYANNVLHNRADALTEAFPTVRQLVGEEFFDAMARAAARVQRSRSGDLNRYGSEFAQFIADFPPAASLGYLADVARLDWLCHLAYYAEDAEAFDLGVLASLTPEEQAGLCFTLHPSVALLRSPDQGQETALVWRNPRHRVRVIRLLPAPAAFLQACAQTLPFAEALERALDADMEFDLGVSLQGWIRDQVISNHSPGELV
jgi:hypothetical protein